MKIIKTSILLALFCGSAAVFGITQKEKDQQLLDTLQNTKLNSTQRLEAVENAIKNGADVNAQDDEGYTPLHYAALRGYKGIVAFLIQNGAKVTTKNNYGSTPLYEAALGGYKGVAVLLIENGADWKVKNQYGQAPNTMSNIPFLKTFDDFYDNKGDFENQDKVTKFYSLHNKDKEDKQDPEELKLLFRTFILYEINNKNGKSSFGWQEICAIYSAGKKEFDKNAYISIMHELFPDEIERKKVYVAIERQCNLSNQNMSGFNFMGDPSNNNLKINFIYTNK